jgi:hypothetical protein
MVIIPIHRVPASRNQQLLFEFTHQGDGPLVLIAIEGQKARLPVLLKGQ